jgi:hypothetical protein
MDVRIAAAVLIAASLGSCATSPRAAQGPITTELAEGDTYRVASHAVSIGFVRVTSDSRCPVGATCVWEGDAVVELRVTPDAVEGETLQLHTNDQSAREATAHGVRIRLERLDPLPSAERPLGPGDYRVVLVVFAD